ncbi:hypothetical protein HDK90DRAFT_479884 [Phyllosticta capitalensis]|uniref:DUF7708 domain-containing protein n=1 Tax=Phyllosticta capitalensis TaxID=121624 RepID=A0ABR1YWA6_9PEZI
MITPPIHCDTNRTMSSSSILLSPDESKSPLLRQTRSNLSNNLAEEAFNKAVSLFKSDFTNDDCKRIWLQDKNTIAHVHQAVDNAKRIYEAKGQSKARKWLTKLSGRIQFYGAILDALVQHHPEYVSLVWGAFKFVFMGVLNQETLIKELAKAMCEIGDALPQADLYLFLYQTDAMFDLSVTLYARIIAFATRAASWYRQNKFKHALSAFGAPYSLQFQDLVGDITVQVSKINQLALAMSAAELRETRLELRQLRKETKSMRLALDEYHRLQYSGIIDTSERVCDIQLSQIMAFTASSSSNSDQARLYYASTRNLRRRRKGIEPSIFQNSKNLKSWGSSPESSIIHVVGSFQVRHVARDFAADMIDLVSEAKIPVVWALQQQGRAPDEYTAVDVLKGLVSQVLTQNETLLNEKSASICATKFQSARTESEWFSLLGHALNGLKDVCFIIDIEAMGLRDADQPSWTDAFHALFLALRTHNVPTKVKVVLVSYRQQLPPSTTPVDKIVIPRRLPPQSKRSVEKSRGKRRIGKLALPGLALR